MIELTEEPYDGPVAALLIEGLLREINCRYGEGADGLTSEELAAADADYLAEVTADDVRPPHGAFVVAWLDGAVAGCGALKRFDPYDGSDPVPGVGEIKRMYTVPEARGRGVGRLVLARLESLAAELGYGRLLLETGEPQPEAIALYEATGWLPIPPYGHYRDSPWSRCFAKDLGP